jgi:aldose 1-epimerase
VTLTTARAAIEVDPADGGRLASLRVDGRELLGASTPPPGMPPAIFSGSFVMAPWAGRLAGGRFSFDGRRYEVPMNVDGAAIHGLAFDRSWERDGDDLVLELDARWPFGGTVRQSFDLRDDGLTVTATIANDARRMPAILGFHPWFAREAGGDPLEYRVQPGARYRTDAAGIPTGELDHSGGGRPWDDSFSGILRAPVLRWGDLEVTIGVTSWNWIVCETMPGGVCIEPLSGPVGGLATGDFAVVEPGRPHTLKLQLTWSTPSQNKEP